MDIDVGRIDDNADPVLASFVDASRLAQQAAYLGFEAYEDLTGWTLGGSQAALAAAIAGGDSFTGLRSLLMAGAGAGSSPLARTLDTREPDGRRYAVTCWIKTETGFHGGPGTGELKVTWAGSGEASKTIPDSAGGWQYFFLLYDLPASGLPQAVTFTWTNISGKPLRIDNIRCSPLDALFTGMAYDPALLPWIYEL